jgi:hypothetical protein
MARPAAHIDTPVSLMLRAAEYMCVQKPLNRVGPFTK